MNALVQISGVHGYSSPCPHHIVFSTTHDIQSYVGMDSVRLLIADHLIVGRGAYNGQQETSYALPAAVFYEMVRRFPFITRGQESILILGTPKARNWRPATLRFIDGSGRADVDLGVWHSVTAEEANEHDNWSYFNNHFFICEIDPPANVYESEERAVQKKLAALESILNTLHVHFDIPLDDPATMAGALDDMLKSKYDEAFRWMIQRMTHAEYVNTLNTGPLFNEKAYNPDEWLNMYRAEDTLHTAYLTAHLRSFAYWMQVNGQWVLK